MNIDMQLFYYERIQTAYDFYYFIGYRIIWLKIVGLAIDFSPHI